MLFTFDFMIPKNTPITFPVTQEVEVKGHVLTNIIVLIPAGHSALTGMQVFYGDLQLVPANQGEWLKGDDETISFPETFELPEPTTTLQLKGYNLDTTNDHTFYVRIITVAEEQYVAPSLITKANTALNEFLRRIVGVRGK